MSRILAEKTSKRLDAHCLEKLEQLAVPVKNLVTDSRCVQPGDTFVAYAGKKTDARTLIPQAISAGANAVIWESRGFTWNLEWQVPSLPITNLREKAGLIADQVYGHPSRQLWIAGFTGTNGKTSCSHWYAQAMKVLNQKAAIMGTLGNGYIDELEPSINTTPEPVLLQKKLAGFLLDGVTHVAMEVSSHGIDQGRINGTILSVAVLTNLSRDHLDYHKDMDAYATTKAQMFFWPRLKYAVLNLDDVFGIELFRQLSKRNIQIIGYGFHKDGDNTFTQYGSRVQGSNLRADLQGLSFDVEYRGEFQKLKTGLIGKFNASNLLAVVATLLAGGVSFTDAVRSLQHVQPIPGRMEKFGGGNRPVVIVDYAHTPDALEKVLITLFEVLQNSQQIRKAKKQPGQLRCVLGCGGERDKGKRKLIGEVAARIANEVIFTSDNPRNEDPFAIINDMIAGAKSNHYLIEANRELAIYQAISGSSPRDIVLIAGKGHETYQEIDGTKTPFSDTLVVQQILQDLSVYEKRG